jgi:hypothetical protein
MSMSWEPVVGYRLRFHPSAGTGDILINHVDANGATQTTPLSGLPADRFAAIAVLLTSDKDHKVLFDGQTLDAGPEKE